MRPSLPFRALAMSPASEGNLQTLAASTVLARSEFVQQPQAVAVSALLAPTVRSRHSWAPALNLVESSEHSNNFVMLGCGQLEGSQAEGMSVWQEDREEVRLVSWAAPGLSVLPAQLRLVLSPPPTERSFW